MKDKKKVQNSLEGLSGKELRVAVAAKLKGRMLFPERVEEARKFLENISSLPKII